MRPFHVLSRGVLVIAGVAVTLGVIAILGVSLPAGADAAKPARPDLKVSTVTAPAGPLSAGDPLSAQVKTSNAGKRRAKAFRAALYLSTDKKKSKFDIRIGSTKFSALKARKSKRKTVKGTVPSSTPPATYRLLACADEAKKIKEKNEKNNCRAAKGTLAITAAGPGGPVANPSTDNDGDGSPNSLDCAPDDASVYPGAPDQPDVPAFRDTNCDGIDGDASRAVFVSPIGSDASPGTRAQPKRTMAAAVNAAAIDGKYVLSTFGTYIETLGVRDGVGVYGGYGTDWSRSLSNETRFDGAGGSSTGALAVGVSAPTTLQLITLAPVAAPSPGGSSYGLRGVSSPGLVIERVVATGRAGANGVPGAGGRNGANGGNGAPGGQGDGDGPFPGDGGGLTHARSGREGGEGGRGGSEGGSSASYGQAGAGSGGGPGGIPGSNGDPGGHGGAGGAGNDGAVGADGAGGSNGTTSGGQWSSNAGRSGTNGTDGFGGGGGGGGGAQRCLLCDDGSGNGGGEGGDGGEAGAAGGGGGGGGGSFGIFLFNSSGAVVRDSTITASNGGRGAAGGSGGQLGGRGLGGLGGTTDTSEVGRGGNGGTGGLGGRGGDGGGGAGGPSIALLHTSSAITDENNTLSFGSGGLGGVGLGGSGTSGAASARN